MMQQSWLRLAMAIAAGTVDKLHRAAHSAIPEQSGPATWQAGEAEPLWLAGPGKGMEAGE
jgi:hypothetical protein